MAEYHLDSHVVDVEIPMDDEEHKSMTIVEDPIAVIQHHPLMEISRSPGHLLLLKLWQREEDLLSRRMAVKESRMDSYRADIFRLCCLLFLFHGLFFTILFSSSSASKEDERKCKKWLIPSFLSLITCLVVVFLVQVDLFRYRKVSRQLSREREDSRALARCVQELRMKGESFDLNKRGPQMIGKKMKSSSVEVKFRPLSWFRDNLVTICLVVFAGLMFPVPKLMVCFY